RQHLAALWRADPDDRLAQARERVAHRLREAPAVVGQVERAMAAMEELDTEVVLERLDLPADGRLREEALLAGLGERQMASGGVEGEREIEGRGAAGFFLHVYSECQKSQ